MIPYGVRIRRHIQDVVDHDDFIVEKRIKLLYNQQSIDLCGIFQDGGAVWPRGLICREGTM